MLEILKDLHLINDDEDSNYNLPKLREILNTHPAFDEENTALNQVAKSYNGKIIWTPKFHCELNPIEGKNILSKSKMNFKAGIYLKNIKLGLWCDSKAYVRKHNDQDFNKLHSLIIKSFEEYEKKHLNIKLWYRFWEANSMYYNGATYQQVLETHFGAKSSSKIVSHKKNKNFNSLLNF
jgi:hypothetical protein